MLKKKNSLTDRQITELLVSLKNQYEKLDKQLSFQEVYDTLGCALVAKMEDPTSEYHCFLDNAEETSKIFEVLTTFVTAVPQARGERHQEPSLQRPRGWFNFQNFAAEYPNRDFPQVTIIHRHYYYNHSSWFYDFWLYSRMISLLDKPRNRHQQIENFKILVALLAAAAAFFVLYVTMAYVWNTVLDSIDRIIHNEGILQSTIAILSLMAGAVVAVGSGAWVFAPLVHSFGFVGLLGMCSASSATGVGVSYMLNLMQESWIRRTNPDALDKNDPKRFCLTESDIQTIKAETFSPGLPPIDPLKVKCAIAALREEMGDMPCASTRFFQKDCKAQKTLKLIRKIRKGELAEVQVGNYQYSLRKTQVAQNVEVVSSNNEDYNAAPVWGAVVR